MATTLHSIASKSDGSCFVVLTLNFTQEGEGDWVGECVELGTTGSGASVEEALEIMLDLTLLHLNALEDVGERDRFFADHGIDVLHRQPSSEDEAPVSVHPGVFATRIVQELETCAG